MSFRCGYQPRPSQGSNLKQFGAGLRNHTGRVRRPGRIRFLLLAPAIVAASVGAAIVPLPVSSVDAGPTVTVSVDGTTDRGPAEFVGSGFLHGINRKTDLARVARVRPQNWRLGGTLVSDRKHSYDLAKRVGAKVTWLLSDDWYQATNNKYPLEDPLLFQRFIRENVRRHKQEYPVDYYDLWNEPNNNDAWREVFKLEYDAIKSVDPEAKIMGPSLSFWRPTPCSPTSTSYPYTACMQGGNLASWDMQSFLQWASDNDIKLDAISWHENYATIGPPATSPSEIVDNVAAARQMLARFPKLGNPEIWINEFGPPQTMGIAGWNVGYLAALERADVAGAMHSCWTVPDTPTGSGVNECFDADNADGLLRTDQTSPREKFDVYAAYADMVGARLATGVSSRGYSAFATRDDAGAEIRALLGRHEYGCPSSPVPPLGNRVVPNCPNPAKPPLPPGNVSVQVKVPWAVSSVNFNVGRLPQSPVFNATSNGFQPYSSGTAPVVDGVATIAVSDFLDGEAFEVVVAQGAFAADPAPNLPAPSFCPIEPCAGGGVAGAWAPTGTSYFQRSRMTGTTLLDGTVLVAGGRRTNGSRPIAKVYDPSSGTWSAAGDLKKPRESHTATLLPDGKVLIAGGVARGWNTVPAETELFDPRTGEFSLTGPINTKRFGHSASTLPDGRVLVAGGWLDGLWYTSATATAEIYDPATGVWTPTTPMSTQRADHTQTVLADGRVLVTGGTQGATSWQSAEIFDPATATWTPVAQMSTARSSHTATRLPDGRVLVAGGTPVSSSARESVAVSQVPALVPSATAEIFDPRLGTWSVTGPMPEARTLHTASDLKDGSVLLTGGTTTDGSFLASTVVFDPSTATWTSSGSMSTTRAFHVATRLQSGRVLVVGGDSGPYELLYPDFVALSSAEVYRPQKKSAPLSVGGL